MSVDGPFAVYQVFASDESAIPTGVDASRPKNMSTTVFSARYRQLRCTTVS